MKIKKSARHINRIIIHSTATPQGREVSVDDITRWHIARGFSTIGYHYLIGLDGTIDLGRSIHQIGAHAKGQNRRSIGVAYVGGCDSDMNPKDTRTEAQDMALTNLLRGLLAIYPGCTIHGHNEFSTKACPSFNVQEEYGFVLDPIIDEEVITEEEREDEE
jgi:N-acetylmuramoyl-L-alanine amidase|tara:strand:- start:2546 stop:3028 length:483 start_codon:yes stop_codon:yes gene_type:complete